MCFYGLIQSTKRYMCTANVTFIAEDWLLSMLCKRACMPCLAVAMQVIADITRRMGAGMAKYIQQDVETIADYDEYCHFVAGLVGVGLSQVSLNL